MSIWYRQKRIDDIDILLCERTELSEQAVEETEPMMKPYRNRSTTWDYRSASALIYEAFRLHDIPLELYRVSDSGRPYIAEGRGDISVSHSGQYTAVTITDNPDQSIGIDIEEIERARKRNVPGIAKRFFPESEYEQVRTAEDPVIEFLNLWTQKEAQMKALRVPLAQTLRGDEASQKYQLQQFWSIRGGEDSTEASRGISVTSALSSRFSGCLCAATSKQ